MLYIFSFLNTICYFLMLINTWQSCMSNWQGMSPIWSISISFVYTELLVWAFPQSHRVNLMYCLKSSLLLAFSFLLVCMVDQIQMCPSSISPLGLFHGIIFNIERLKRGTNTTVPMATKFGRFVTYQEGLSPIKSHAPLIEWSCEITNIYISTITMPLAT